MLPSFKKKKKRKKNKKEDDSEGGTKNSETVADTYNHYSKALKSNQGTHNICAIGFHKCYGPGSVLYLTFFSFMNRNDHSCHPMPVPLLYIGCIGADNLSLLFHSSTNRCCAPCGIMFKSLFCTWI